MPSASSRRGNIERLDLIAGEAGMDIKGGCLCGAVRYSATVEQAAATVCHCRDCQKFTGSAFATLVAVPKEAVTIDGTRQPFSSLGGSGKPILRHFCPRCGASLAEESSG